MKEHFGIEMLIEGMVFRCFFSNSYHFMDNLDAVRKIFLINSVILLKECFFNIILVEK